MSCLVARRDVLLPVASRALLLIVVATSIAISLPSLDSDAPAIAGSDLTNLLRFMAALKGGLALVVLVAVFWRLAAPISLLRLAPYAIASGTMVAGPGLIWGMSHVGLGALLLHGGLFASVVLLWRDPATALRLRHIVAQRSKTR